MKFIRNKLGQLVLYKNSYIKHLQELIYKTLEDYEVYQKQIRSTCTLQELIYKTLEDYEVYQKQIWSTCTLQAYQKQIINNFLSIKLFGESSNLLCIFYDLLCMFKKNHCISQYRNIIYFNV